jgi:hypothetical protein
MPTNTGKDRGWKRIQGERLWGVLAATIGITITAIDPVMANSFDRLADQYQSYDLQCQATGNNCWARDQVGEQLMQMGGRLCGRRDWVSTPEAANAAGCQ